MIHLWDNSCYLSKNVWCFLETLHQNKHLELLRSRIDHLQLGQETFTQVQSEEVAWRQSLDAEYLRLRTSDGNVSTRMNFFESKLHQLEKIRCLSWSSGENTQGCVVKIWWSPCLVSLASLTPKSQLRTNWKCWIVGIVPHMFSKSSLRSFPRHSDMIPIIPMMQAISDSYLPAFVGRSTSSNAQGSTLQRQMEEMDVLFCFPGGKILKPCRKLERMKHLKSTNLELQGFPFR